MLKTVRDVGLGNGIWVKAVFGTNNLGDGLYSLRLAYLFFEML